MAKNHLEFVRSAVDAGAIRATAEGMGQAAVLTDTELVLGTAGLFKGWGSKVQRYDLNRLHVVRSVHYPSANMLCLHFTGTPPQSVSVMYNSDARPAFEPIVAALEAHAAANEAATVRVSE